MSAAQITGPIIRHPRLVLALLAGTIVTLVLIILMFTAGRCCQTLSIVDAANVSNASLMLFEPRDDVGPYPFMSDRERVEASAPPATIQPGTGLYGGSLSETCDPELLISFLTSHPAKGQAWADVVGIPVASIPDFIRSLTPTVLTVDTLVTNHGFKDGKALPWQMLLEAGTAVLMKPDGTVGARCACGNPLIFGNPRETPRPSAPPPSPTTSVTPGASPSPEASPSESPRATDRPTSVDLGVEKRSEGKFEYGALVRYTINVANAGAGTAVAPIIVHDQLPPGASLDSWNGDNWDCTVDSSGLVTCTFLRDLSGGESAPPLVLGVQLASERDWPEGTTVVSNCASFEYPEDTNRENNQSCVEDPLRPTGRIVFVSGHDINTAIYTMDADGSNVTQLTTAGSFDSNPVWSPDGTQIAFDTARDGNGEIYVMNADGTNPHNVTNSGADDIEPAWSPDGTKIAFRSVRDGNWEIFVMDANGANQQQLTNADPVNEQPVWSPDGTRIAFSATHAGSPGTSGVDIFVMDANGANQVNITNSSGDEYEPSWSPDGTRIAFRKDYGHIYVMNSNGTNAVQVTQGGGFETDPVWSPDGNWIAYVHYTQTSLDADLWITDPSGTNKFNITNSAVNEAYPDW
ncbi:MAG: hypothetical protein QOJ81_908 [Chloroflexota bacterium]|nr:hypothetical protein [Chloroflexota bacterium]